MRLLFVMFQGSKKGPFFVASVLHTHAHNRTKLECECASTLSTELIGFEQLNQTQLYFHLHSNHNT